MKLFGTDGIRGIVGEKLTEELAYRIGRAYGLVLASSGKRCSVLLGRDTRVSGQTLMENVARGLNSARVDVVIAGILPTPAHTYLSKIYGVDGGVMITASHNPPEHNGLKFCDGEGNKLSQETQMKIEELALAMPVGVAYNADFGGKTMIDLTLVDSWKEYILDSLGNPDFSGIKVALDMANGAGFEIIPEVFRKTGATVLPFFTESDGKNINRDCGSVNVDKFVKTCLDNNADIGFSFDGDADRIMVVARNGQIVDGTDLMYIFGRYYAQKGKLVGDTVVSTIVTNSGLDRSLGKYGINLVRTQVGGQYVQREMTEHGYVIGGEENGHMLLGDIGEGSDGMCIGLYLLKIMKEQNADVLDLLQDLERAKIAKSDLHVTEAQKKAVENGALEQTVHEMESRLGNRGRIVLRTSGTESVVRILVEGEEQPLLDEINLILSNKVKEL